LSVESGSKKANGKTNLLKRLKKEESLRREMVLGRVGFSGWRKIYLEPTISDGYYVSG
jgi:hypothetical protein